MAESSVIREFLVALGFKSDEAALKKFETGISKASKAVVGLATAVEATALTVSIGVARFASNLEALYFASLKTGASATNLKAFDRGAQNLGTSVGEALQSVQGLAHFMRVNPGGEGLLSSLGIQTRDANHQLRDTTDIMLGLSHAFAKMPFYLANQYAGMFGISEDTLRAMRSDGFEKEIVRMREQMRDAGFDKASKDAHRFMMQLRDLQTQLEAFGTQVYDAISKKLGVSLTSVTEWLRTNGPMLATRVAEILSKVIDVSERIGRAIRWLVDKFIEWDKATDGWSTRLLGLLVVLKFFGGAELIGGIVSLGSAFIRLGAGIAAAAASGSGFIGLFGKAGLLAAAAAAGYEIGTLINDYVLPQTWKDNIGKGIAITGMALGSKTAKEAVAINDPAFYLHRYGWSKEQVAGILANLQAESGLNPHAVGDHGKAYGIAQWHPDRQAAFTKWAGHDIHQSSMAEQLDFMDYELKYGAERKAGALLRATRSSQAAGEVMSRFYERPAAADAEAKKRGEAAVNISQKTEIKVDGAGDPSAVGREVMNQQNRVVAEMTRNLQLAVQ